MNVISEKEFIELRVEYDNTKIRPRKETIEYLDKRFGESGYCIKRGGPKHDDQSTGLIIAHADIK